MKQQNTLLSFGLIGYYIRHESIYLKQLMLYKSRNISTLHTMQQSADNRSLKKLTNQPCLKKQPLRAQNELGATEHSNIIDFIKSFKPLNVSTNLLRAPAANKRKRRNTNYSHKIIENMRERFYHLPPAYLKKRRMEKLNSYGREQRKRYRHLLDTIREDTENCPPAPHNTNTLTTMQPNGMYYPLTTNRDYFSHNTDSPATPNVTEDYIDSLLEEELHCQGAYIDSTMDELYSIARIPSGEATSWNFYTNQWPCDEAYEQLNAIQNSTVGYHSVPPMFYSEPGIYPTYDTALLL